MAVPPAPDVRSGVTEDNRDANDSSASTDSSNASAEPSSGRQVSAPRFRLGLLVALVVLLVGATAVVAYLAATRAVPALGVGGEQEQIQQEREDVMSRAGQFMLRVNTYGPDELDENNQMPEYRKSVEELLTPKFAEDFAQGVTAAEQTVAQAGLGRTATVFSAGVSVIDSDSATALVAGSFVNSYPNPDEKSDDERVETDPAPFRVEVKMVKIDGEWLVDDFTPLTGEQDQPAAEETQP